MYYRFEIIDLLPYLLLYTCCLYFSIRNKKNDYLFVGLFLFLFSAFRYGIGYDFFAYTRLIEGTASYRDIEWISQLLMDIAKKINWTHFYFLINSLVVIFPIVLIAKRYSTNKAFSVFAFYLIPLFFLDSMSIIRNASAYSIVFLSFLFLERKKILVYILLCIIAGGFHQSGYIGLILLPLYYLRFGSKLNLIIFIISIAFSFLGLSSKIISLLTSIDIAQLQIYLAYSTDQGRFMKFILFFIGSINLLFERRLILDNYYNKQFIKFFNVGLLIWSIFSFDHTLSLRLASFFLLFEILIVPSYVLIFGEKNKTITKQIVYTFFTLYLASSFFVNIVGYSPEWGNKISFLPYQTVFYYKNYTNYN